MTVSILFVCGEYCILARIWFITLFVYINFYRQNMNIGLTITKDDSLLVRLRIKRGLITHIVLR